MNKPKKLALYAAIAVVAAGIAAALGVAWKGGERRVEGNAPNHADSLFCAGGFSRRSCGGFGETALPSTTPCQGGERRVEGNAPYQDAATEYHEMKVVEFGAETGSAAKGGMTVYVLLSERPDVDAAARYVSAGPLRSGGLRFSESKSSRYGLYDGKWQSKAFPTLRITGDFEYRTNLTLTVRKGFPIGGLASGGNVVAEPLAEDYVHGFARTDVRPEVRFNDDGRYLPPAGRRGLSVGGVNVRRIKSRVAPIQPSNIVNFLALEEGAYNGISRSDWWGRDGDDPLFAADLAGERWGRDIEMANPLNERETAFLPLAPEGAAAAPNGAYFVSIEGVYDDHGADGGADAKERKTQMKCRVVCMSDIGLSVRKTPQGFRVWAASLTKGTPLAGVRVEARTKANEVVASGVTGSDGLCLCGAAAPDDAFAVVASAADGSDATFLALRGSMSVDEKRPAGCAGGYLDGGDLDAFAWSDRGIYRHGERIMFHALVRDGRGAAPPPTPFEVAFVKPSGAAYRSVTAVSDGRGALCVDGVAIPDDQPSGDWRIEVRVPGDGRVLGSRRVKIEEFAPPQIRVAVEAADGAEPSAFSFAVSAEHLYGGPAAGMKCEGAVVFEDAAFAPEGWGGWTFGDESRSLKPNFRVVKADATDADGRSVVAAPLWAEAGLPAAAVKATAQGTVFEDGGRPATARATAYLHHYPHYVGTTLKTWTAADAAARPKIAVACVGRDGRRLAEPRRLAARLVRRDRVYGYRIDEATGAATWNCEKIDTVLAEGVAVETPSGGDAEFEIPADAPGEYFLSIEDAECGASFGKRFWIADGEGGFAEPDLSNPTAVAVTPDKPFYRPGERPRLRVVAPFAGTALLTVMRGDVVYEEVFSLTNEAAEVELRAADASWAPNVNASLVVLKGAEGAAVGLAARAHGEAAVRVRLAENEIAPRVSASFAGRVASVEIDAPGADAATVTLVDEGINILTGERTPDPIAHFAAVRAGWLPLFDLYGRILPAYGDLALKANGAKTGGDVGAELLDRISPVATRRFKPLAMWRNAVPLADGKARVEFELPEFAGEVRVTALAYSANAAGCAAARCKVAPKVVAQPDAPRFAAPGDEFEMTLPLANRSGADGEIEWETSHGETRSGKAFLRDGEKTVVRLAAKAPDEPGETALRFKASGFGETHEFTIDLPVRPAVAWRETNGVAVLHPGETFRIPQGPEGRPSRTRHHVSANPVSELRGALEWLADYPHGCLEQTASRIFPLVAAGGILNALGSVEAVNRAEYVAAGVRRVESMIRERDFTMWPDCNYAPWDREVSLYAAHFLVEAKRGGAETRRDAKVVELLRGWAMSPTNAVSAYACHTLALAGKPEKDRMYRLYDARRSLDRLSRARLARAFAATGDGRRAAELLMGADDPQSVKEAAFALLATLETDPDAPSAARLAAYLTSRRDGARFSWGTTSDNAHALLALGEFWRRQPAKEGKCDVREAPDGSLVNKGDGSAFVSWKRLDLPALADAKAEASGLALTRTFFAADGTPYDIGAAKRGDLVVVRIAVSCDEERDLSDLVIEDLFAGAMEPVREKPDFPWMERGAQGEEWVMRSDARDDRMLVFSKRAHVKKGEELVFHHSLRVVSAGRYVQPQASVEAMYAPALRAKTAPSRLVAR